MRRALSGWQGFAALIVSIALFWLSGDGIRWIEPTAGVFDLGYIQRPLVAASYFFFATFCAWAAFQIEFPTIDRWLDYGGFRDAWRDIPEQRKITYLFMILTVLFFGFLACLALVPV